MTTWLNALMIVIALIALRQMVRQMRQVRRMYRALIVRTWLPLGALLIAGGVVATLAATGVLTESPAWWLGEAAVALYGAGVIVLVDGLFGGPRHRGRQI